MVGAPTSLPSTTREAWIRVATTPTRLDDLRAQPAGDARRAAVVARLQAATDAGLAPARDALQAALDAAGVHGASVDVVEPLWIDGSARVRIAASGDGSLAAIDAVLAAREARVLTDGAGADANAESLATSPGHVWSVRREEAQPPAAADAPRQWFDDVLGFAQARATGLDGSGVRVAVVDSGVEETHPQLDAALGRGARLDRFSGIPIRSGHGTFVSGLVAGRDTGLAPGVDLISSRTYGAGFGDHAGATPAERQTQRFTAMRALQDALAPPDGARGADVLVTSWGILDQPGVPARDYDGAMAAIAAAGAVVVAAAGNDGARGDGGGTLAVPAQLDDVIAVGGIDRSGAWHPGASVGPSPRTERTKPDVSAPVVDVRSSALGGGVTDTTGQPGNGFAGTSAAAPIAAAALAVLAQAVRRTGGGAAPDIDEVRSALDLLTIDVDAPGPDPRTGAGVIAVRRVEEAAARIIAARAARERSDHPSA